LKEENQQCTETHEQLQLALRMKDEQFLSTSKANEEERKALEQQISSQGEKIKELEQEVLFIY